MKRLIILSLLFINVNAVLLAQQKKVLLIGTFHFHNPGADVAKTKSFDITTPQAQSELEMISEKIKLFHPDKIFVEWDYLQQPRLDSLYKDYLNGNWKLWQKNWLKNNEIFQLGGRTAQKLHLPTLYAFDYDGTDFPYDSLQAVLKAAKQENLVNDIAADIKSYSDTFDSLIEKGTSLTDLLLFENKAEERKSNIGWYTRSVTQAGDKNNFIGAFLASEWYRRNIYMWSLIQKSLSSSDQRIMILVGAGHAAVLQSLIDLDPDLERIELKNILAH